MYYQLNFYLAKSSCYPWEKELLSQRNCKHICWWIIWLRNLLSLKWLALICFLSFLCVWEKARGLLWWKLKCFIYSYNTFYTQQEHRLLLLPCQYFCHGETICGVCRHILIRKFQSKRLFSIINKSNKERRNEVGVQLRIIEHFRKKS